MKFDLIWNNSIAANGMVRLSEKKMPDFCNMYPILLGVVFSFGLLPSIRLSAVFFSLL